MNWFGEPWPSAEARAPVCVDDAERVPVPVGEICLFCSEPIAEGDRGEVMSYVGMGALGPYASTRPTHIECVFRQGVGGPAHVQGTCTCHGGPQDPDLGMSPREAALWVWEHYTGESGFYKYDDPPEEGRVR